MITPLSTGYVTQGFRPASNPAHGAVDIGWWRVGVVDPPIYAWDAGTVLQSAYSTVGGNYVVLKHDRKEHYYLTRYFHLKNRMVKVGDRVHRWQTIGIGGSTGTSSTGPHLHFEILALPKDFVFINMTSAIREKYSLNPLLYSFLTQAQEITGGFKYMTIDTNKVTLAIPTVSSLNLRSAPVEGTSANVVGKVPAEGLVFKGVTNANGRDWALVDWNGLTCYCAFEFIKLKYHYELVEVPVVKPFDKVFEDAEITVTVQTKPLK